VKSDNLLGGQVSSISKPNLIHGLSKGELEATNALRLTRGDSSQAVERVHILSDHDRQLSGSRRWGIGRNEQSLTILTIVVDIWHITFLFIRLVEKFINIVAIVKDIVVALKRWGGSFTLLDIIRNLRWPETLVKASLVLE
jgi:hypothetical protein